MTSPAISWDDASGLQEELLDGMYIYHNEIIAEIRNNRLPWWDTMFGWMAAGACVTWGIFGGLVLWRLVFGSV